MKEKYLSWEKKCSRFFRARAITYLRLSMAFIYFFYGLLKIIGVTPPPLKAMIVVATDWVNIPYFFTILGIWEMLIGFFLFIKKWQRFGLILLFLQIPGTFLPLFIRPDEYFLPFQNWISLEGKYILKNIVFIAAGLVLVGFLHEDNT